jgi:hypothetical protein
MFYCTVCVVTVERIKTYEQLNSADATLHLFAPLRRRQRLQFAFHIFSMHVFLYKEEIPGCIIMPVRLFSSVRPLISFEPADVFSLNFV